MALIKSALELALEKTRDVEVDREGLRRRELSEQGMRLLSRGMEDPSLDLKQELQKVPAGDRAAVRDGLAEAFMRNIALPVDRLAAGRLPDLQRVFGTVTGDAETARIVFEQLQQLYDGWLKERQRLVEQLREQFEPRIRQREEQVYAQTGQRVRLDPSSDPEFAQALNHYMGQIEQQYGGVLEQLRPQLESLISKG